MILGSVRRTVQSHPLATTVVLAVLSGALAIGSLVGVLLTAERTPAVYSYGSIDVAGCAAGAPATPKRQFRAMWITSVANIDWPSRPGLDQATIKAEYLSWLDVAVRNRLNAVVVQVRGAGDAFWPGAAEPWSQYLTGVRGADPGWDPVGFAVAEAHRRGLEFHAWFNPYRGSMPAPTGAGTDPAQLPADHPLRKHPEWAVAYPVAGAGARLHYNPGEPAARRFVEDLMLDVVRRYDVDGVPFDDFFYPYQTAGKDFGDDASFAANHGDFTDRAAWRRNNIDLMIKEMHERIHALKPWVRFGVSPFGIWRNARDDPAGSATTGNQSYTANYADTRTWVKQGWIDYIVPQLYWNIGFTVADYATLVAWWSQTVAGTNVQLYIGQAPYRLGSGGAWNNPGELSAHLALNRRYPQVTGDVYFSAKDVRADRLGGMAKVVAEHYPAPALTPRIGTGTAGTRSAPVITSATPDPETGSVVLAWQPPSRPVSGADQVRSYAVYRFDEAAPTDRCGFADAGHLIATTSGHTVTDASAVAGHRYAYLVTAVDRMGRESDASAPSMVGAAGGGPTG